LIVHADSARPHTAKLSMAFVDANRMTRALHLPDSPDLARSAFFLFGDVKQQLSGCPSIMPMICLLPFRRFWTVLTQLR
jgi:hypothetical protein